MVIDLEKNKNFCPLCKGKKIIYYCYRKRTYYKCEKCHSISLCKNDHLSNEEEKKRYLEHNNNIEDSRYQDFVIPIVSAILNDFKEYHKGLDYGAGTGPVITKMLTDHAYNIKPYDPYFHNFPDYLKEEYDYIVCCEVMEHFYNPYNEFKRLKNLLHENGKLYCKTELFKEGTDFKTWYYKNDPTHVFFYTEKAIFWIKNHFYFKNVSIENRLIIFNN